MESIKEKRAKIEEYMISNFKLIEPGGTNASRYEDMFKKMSDEEFDQYMKDLKDGKTEFNFFTPNLKVSLKLKDALKAADAVKLALFERIWMHDPISGRKYMPKHKYLIVQLCIRRVKQYLYHKLSVPEGANRTDAITGQVIEPDKASSLSLVEMQSIYAKGLTDTLTEMIKIRGGDVEALGEFKRQLEETGTATLSTLGKDTKARSVHSMSMLLTCAHIGNNLAE